MRRSSVARAALPLAIVLALPAAPEPTHAQELIWDRSAPSDLFDSGADFAIHGQNVVASQAWFNQGAWVTGVTFWANEYLGWLNPGSVNWWFLTESAFENFGTGIPGDVIASGSASTERSLESDEGPFRTYRYSFAIRPVLVRPDDGFYLALNASSPGSTGAFAWAQGDGGGDTHLSQGTLESGKPVWPPALLHLVSARFQLEGGFVSVSEPGSVVLLATGLIGLGYLRRPRGLRNRREGPK